MKTKMRAGRMRKLAKHIETMRASKFAMEHFMYHKPRCGTVGCIAGQQLLLDGYTLDKSGIKYISPEGKVCDTSKFSEMDVASKALGLHYDQAAWLFLAQWLRGTPRTMSTVTPEEAAHAIRMMIKHPVNDELRNEAMKEWRVQ